MAALANGLFVLVQSEEGGEGFSDAAEALYTTYKLLMLGDFDDAGFAIGDTQVQAKLFFFVSSVLGTIVILNLLIARMGDSCVLPYTAPLCCAMWGMTCILRRLVRAIHSATFIVQWWKYTCVFLGCLCVLFISPLFWCKGCCTCAFVGGSCVQSILPPSLCSGG